jgi:hypothetical protein
VRHIHQERVTEQSEPHWPHILVEAAAALSREAGSSISIGDASLVIDGWTAQHGEYPNIRRCVASSASGRTATSVIVKTQRPASHWRGGNTIPREWAALTLLTELGANVGPRVLAHGEDFLVLEDLGRGPAVEDLLVGDDPAAATEALVALARSVAAMQAVSLGHELAFRHRLDALGINSHADRLTLAGATVANRWATLRELAAADPAPNDRALPDTRVADADIDELTAHLAEPGPLLALSNGDLAPQNCRLSGGSVRLLDFEDASYRHLLLDAAHLRLPFCGAPCWSRLPVDVTDAMEAAFRAELGRSCPALLDPRTYSAGMAIATAAWTVTRLVRLPKLLARDEPHPMGFSRRGQLLDTIQCAIDAAAAARILTDLRAWFEQTALALRRIWPGLPPQQELYPAFRSDENLAPSSHR